MISSGSEREAVAMRWSGRPVPDGYELVTGMIEVNDVDEDLGSLNEVWIGKHAEGFARPVYRRKVCSV